MAKPPSRSKICDICGDSVSHLKDHQESVDCRTTKALRDRGERQSFFRRGWSLALWCLAHGLAIAHSTFKALTSTLLPAPALAEIPLSSTAPCVAQSRKTELSDSTISRVVPLATAALQAPESCPN